MDTIFALASAPGRAGVSVVRVSGLNAHEVGRLIAGDLPSVGRSGLRTLRSLTGDVLDQALVLVFSGPNSFTGEDIVEFQVHGSVSVVKSLLSTLAETGLARAAEAGEFTRRALMNDRLDLAQVEGLGALIEAETEAQQRLAMKVFSGRLGDVVEEWRKALLRAAALLEATIDFADEEVPVDVTDEVVGLISAVSDSLDKEIAGSHVAERIRDGFEVSILGAPNAGKSTLLNALAGREAAITSEIAGTTRDVIEVRMDLGGLAVTLLDTAGLREAQDQIEQIGIARARDRAAAADLRVYLKTTPNEVVPIELEKGDIVRIGKADLFPSLSGGVSGLSGAGVSDLVNEITDQLLNRAARAETATHARHRDAMVAALSALVASRSEVESGMDRAEFAAEHIREAVRRLDGLVGRIDVEAVLGEIFASFCIGK
ncbi:tRNA uridine-5-carboxymethylaminomethyl(34) synthesis GTPase MnmE [Roseobacter sp. HKCCD9010]|uniref:tRNA uridine-5-carboxymethylaminomethyl(34) synthesis GTPase MnmE n=1 Tax=unclassified Roseobacter TaxID=196798 RepID=UPI0014911E99|nr:MULTISPECIES: tRNA uridine-5-carboxymethylaminomethyl(34) synthesis GTPase MnmE [unclassified Roseobacter]MBF9048441.1 tRNA uridine-5-carboxymethylaminomethyl(34) synthesis GTPase MnmE [Rhodobacterales bacterium HKCCD4356]NNV10440.1 tRNA uridine-5-carboxymethylaminomethyl(34) synthesis GTPase MnmE [Roseobacter sp. HKCCD7357]NNV14625.1 tRNA uridine-5-carboxymethylaminomethyl(34) synthesis GTPase MnmE [Roseobacter sp. HKCCD8768]NNV24084.1 tRNA uridine-5-carboxymethylaminomethyl(34) synthesis G